MPKKKRKLSNDELLRTLENEAIKILTMLYAQADFANLIHFKMEEDGKSELLMRYGDGVAIKLTIKAEMVGEDDN